MKHNDTIGSHSFYQGLSRQACVALCEQKQKMVIHFAHWLAIVEEGIVLSFRHQVCTEVRQINL